MEEVKVRSWTEDEHHTWQRLFERLDHCRKHQAHPVFARGVDELGIVADRIPTMDHINSKLYAKTGWRGVPVEGLVDGRIFLMALADRCFPVGNFIRDKNDINYTPAPDIFHDLYGHLPFLMDDDYANFCQRLGELAVQYRYSKEAIRKCERLFWFGVEFPLTETRAGRRIFGGGILSSLGESNYSLSDEPEVVAFELADIIQRDYNINEMQKRIYLLSGPRQLYECLPQLETFLADA